ncbi:MAG TPA: histidine kinase [Chitinophagales bacterium]|nr:histidine kinase [Chitinophagales bacterium]
MKSTLLFLGCFLSGFHWGIAQIDFVDSLSAAIQDSQDDSNKVSALEILSRELWNQDREFASVFYSNTALALKQKLVIQKQVAEISSDLESAKKKPATENAKSLQALDAKLESIERRQDTLNASLKEYEKRSSSLTDDLVVTARQNKERIANEQRATIQHLQNERIKRNWIIAGSIITVALLSIVFIQVYRRRQALNKLGMHLLNNKVLRSQLNPHFIFHALNSIRTFMEQRPELADNYLVKFSTLMRQVLENSEEEKISLSEEIAMIENYMQLEAIRIPGGFDYEVSFDESIDADFITVPPLILQPMIENAILHGLMPLNRRGKILIHFKEKNGLLEATIEDDGIGLGSTMVDSRTAEKKRSMGMQITRERIELLNRKVKTKGSLVQQLFEQGSQVRIEIPV